MDITVLEVTMGTASMMAHFHQDLLFVWEVSSVDLMSYNLNYPVLIFPTYSIKFYLHKHITTYIYISY